MPLGCLVAGDQGTESRSRGQGDLPVTPHAKGQHFYRSCSAGAASCPHACRAGFHLPRIEAKPEVIERVYDDSVQEPLTASEQGRD